MAVLAADGSVAIDIRSHAVQRWRERIAANLTITEAAQQVMAFVSGGQRCALARVIRIQNACG